MGSVEEGVEADVMVRSVGVGALALAMALLEALSMLSLSVPLPPTNTEMPSLPCMTTTAHPLSPLTPPPPSPLRS